MRWAPKRWSVANLLGIFGTPSTRTRCAGHHLASYNPGTGRVDDKGVLAIRNPDFAGFQTRPHCHGYQTFADGKVAPKKHHFALTIN